MKITKSLVFILLTVVITLGQQLPSASAQSSFCDVQALTTPQLLLSINQDTYQTIDRSLFKIKRTQTYEKETKTINLAYTQSEGDLLIEQTTTNLASKIYTEDIVNNLLYIDSRDDYILALETVNVETSQYSYVLLKADILNNTNTLMSKSYLNKQKTQSDTLSQQIVQTDILRILSIDSQNIFLLVNQGTQQALYKVELINTQTQVQNQKEFIFLANINDPNLPANLIGENIFHLYDRNSVRFYQLTINTQTREYSYAAKMLSELSIDTLMNLDNLYFVSLANNLQIMISYLNGQTIMIPLSQTQIQPQKALKLIGNYKIYTDNWKNTLIVTNNDFIWIRTLANNIWAQKLFSTTLPLAQRDQLQQIMSNAQFISFDGKYAMIVSRNLGNGQGSLTSVLFDTQSAPYFKIVDRLKNSIDLSQLSFSNYVGNQTTTNKIESYSTSFKCNCVNLEVQRIECFAGPLKCITVTKPVRTDCTKTQ